MQLKTRTIKPTFSDVKQVKWELHDGPLVANCPLVCEHCILRCFWDDVAVFFPPLSRSGSTEGGFKGAAMRCMVPEWEVSGSLQFIVILLSSFHPDEPEQLNSYMD